MPNFRRDIERLSLLRGGLQYSLGLFTNALGREPAHDLLGASERIIPDLGAGEAKDRRTTQAGATIP
ncbi:hypothetical protein [Bradyrhizobium nitroreducens]|uniref:hypothetical protein n=1 Tax=Bradyrhizobium nitroreducens TaxID=709803 RepID=UPI0011AE1BEC|nr:hypothetical protein [Bradyrhizobium nitroreducens]